MFTPQEAQQYQQLVGQSASSSKSNIYSAPNQNFTKGPPVDTSLYSSAQHVSGSNYQTSFGNYPPSPNMMATTPVSYRSQHDQPSPSPNSAQNQYGNRPQIYQQEQQSNQHFMQQRTPQPVLVRTMNQTPTESASTPFVPSPNSHVQYYSAGQHESGNTQQTMSPQQGNMDQMGFTMQPMNQPVQNSQLNESLLSIKKSLESELKELKDHNKSLKELFDRQNLILENVKSYLDSQQVQPPQTMGMLPSQYPTQDYPSMNHSNYHPYNTPSSTQQYDPNNAYSAYHQSMIHNQ